MEEFRKPRAPWAIALLTSLVVLALTVVTAVRFLNGDGSQGDGENQLGGVVAWLPAYGVNLALGLDGVSVWFMLLVGIVTPLSVIASRSNVTAAPGPYYLLLLILESALLGLFLASDLVLFYVFFELTLIPIFFLLAGYGLNKGRQAALTYFLYAFTGSMLTLASILYLGFNHANETGAWSFLMADLVETAPQLAERSMRLDLGLAQFRLPVGLLVMMGLLAGFLVKVPIWPLHHYLPLAHREAPSHGAVDLAALTLKLGPFAILKIALPLCPAAAVMVAPSIGMLALISIVGVGLLCWTMRDAKRLLAYASVAHMGFVLLGLFALDADALGATGAVFYVLSYTLSAGGMFLLIGMMYQRVGTYRLDEVGGLAAELPVWAFFMVFFAMASVGLPGLNGFVGEFMTAIGTFESPAGVLGPAFAACAVLGVIVAAMYLLKLVGATAFGPLKIPLGKTVHDLDAREVGLLLPLAGLCLVLGLMPQPVLNTMEPTVQAWIGPAREAALAAATHDDSDHLEAPQETTPDAPGGAPLSDEAIIHSPDAAEDRHVGTDARHQGSSLLAEATTAVNSEVSP